MKTIILLFLFYIVFVSADQPKCHEEEVLDPSGQYCFIVDENPKSFHDAEKECYKYAGFHLATIPSMIDNAFVFDLIRKAEATSNYFWIGATDMTSSGDWQWIDGTPMSFKNWSPNNRGRENCATMMIDGGKWQEYSCERPLPFVCYGPARGSPTDKPLPVRHETVYIKFVGDAESMGDPNTNAQAKDFYNREREFIHSIADYLFLNTKHDNNDCKYYANPAFYGYTEYEQHFARSPAWSKNEFDNILEGNKWDDKTDVEFTMERAITTLHGYYWNPPLEELGYSLLVFFTARQDFNNVPSLFDPKIKAFDEIVIVSMNGSQMKTPAGVTNVQVSNKFDQNDVQAVVNQILCH